MLAQIIAVVIFLAMFVFIVMDKIERQIVTLVCGLLTMVLVFGLCMHSLPAIWETLNVKSIFSAHFWYQSGNAAEASTGINWETIIFIAGMMIMVEGMAAAGFFRWLCMELAKLVHYRTIPIFMAFMVMSSLLAMFIDSITVILFLAVASVRLAHLLKFDPIPLIIAEIFTANLGGAATMSGDPPNIIIGTALGLSFGDFLRNTGVIVLVGMVVMVPYFYFCFRKQVQSWDPQARQKVMELDPRDSIHNRGQFAIHVILFLVVVVLLITHAQTGLTVATVGIIAAILTLLVNRWPLHLLRRVDWKTVLFFIGLFLAVSGLEQTGVLEAMADGIAHLTGGNHTLMIGIILWLSGVASAFVDNIPFAATMVPVITSLSATMGADLNTLAWTLSMGTDIGGSATPIGASANVAGTSIAAREGHPISWGRYCKYSAPASVLVLAISMGMLLLRY